MEVADTHLSRNCSSFPCDPSCTNPGGFDVFELQNITQSIYTICTENGTGDIRLATWRNGTIIQPPSLTARACGVIAGGLTTPTWYPSPDVWQRWTSWKFPLIQLAAQFPRPPLGKRVEWFTFTHLLGNPIGTLQDLLIKFASCQARALYWKHQFCTCFKAFAIDDDFDDTAFAKLERHWKAFAIIVDSCDEWGLDDGDHTSKVLRDILAQFTNLEESAASNQHLQAARRIRKLFLKSCLRTGKALAADRGTKLFPMTVAMILFIATYIVAFIRTSSVGANSTKVLVAVEAYSVAFSSTFFWILPITVLGAAIGSSQTETAIPRILKRLERETNALLGIHEDDEQSWIQVVNPEINEMVASTKSWQRQRDGGIYSWQQAKWSTSFWHPSTSVKRIRDAVELGHQRLEIENIFPWYPLRPQWLRASLKVNQPPTQISSKYPHISHAVRAAGDSLCNIFFWMFRAVYWCHRPFLPIVPGSPVFCLWVVFLALLKAWAIVTAVPGEAYSCRFFGLLGGWLLFWLSWVIDFMELAAIARFVPEPAKTKPNEGSLRRMSWQAHSRFDRLVLRPLRDESNRNSVRFYSQGLKDLFVLIAMLVWIIVTQCGILNSCNCYTLWGTRRLILPTSPEVAETLHHRVWGAYFVITLCFSLYMLVVIPGLVAWQFFEAWQVFVQRDDKTSNWNWAQKQREAALDLTKPPSRREYRIKQDEEYHREISQRIRNNINAAVEKYSQHLISGQERSHGVLATDEEDLCAHGPGGISLPPSRPLSPVQHIEAVHERESSQESTSSDDYIDNRPTTELLPRFPFETSGADDEQKPA